ncbi:MAG: hypothetical protein JJE09_04200 [Bacteroidia bacterium]|nr:hypothetical protein [Bacteroidia bacterium]
MQILKLSFISIYLILPFLSLGQSKEQGSLLPTSLAPAVPKKVQSAHRIKSVAFKKPKVQHTAKYEYYVRIEKAAKQKQKILRKLSKPQYSNPAHFGHKCLPKKRPYWRMRYCKECGIRH